MMLTIDAYVAACIQISHEFCIIRITYECDQCDFACAQYTNLKTHLKTHTGEKPYACSHCEYTSITKSQLTVHMRSHTGGKR